MFILNNVLDDYFLDDKISEILSIFFISIPGLLRKMFANIEDLTPQYIYMYVTCIDRYLCVFLYVCENIFWISIKIL